MAQLVGHVITRSEMRKVSCINKQNSPFPFFWPTNPSENLFAIFFFKGRSLAYHDERKKDNSKINSESNSSKTPTDSDADHELAAGYNYNACLKFRLPKIDLRCWTSILLDLTKNKSNKEDKDKALFNGWSDRRTNHGYPKEESNEGQLHKLSLHENNVGSLEVLSINVYGVNNSKVD